jgi:hypothetical protein
MKTVAWKTPKGIRDHKHPFYDFYLLMNKIAEYRHNDTKINFFTGVVPLPLHQGGIRLGNEKIDYTLKKDFKGYFPMFYEELSQLPQPFTGKMELHLAESVLREVRFLF